MDQSDSETTDTETKWSEDSDWDKEDFLKNDVSTGIVYY